MLVYFQVFIFLISLKFILLLALSWSTTVQTRALNNITNERYLGYFGLILVQWETAKNLGTESPFHPVQPQTFFYTMVHIVRMPWLCANATKVKFCINIAYSCWQVCWMPKLQLLAIQFVRVALIYKICLFPILNYGGLENSGEWNRHPITPHGDYTIHSVCNSWMVYIRSITQGQHPIGTGVGGV